MVQDNKICSIDLGKYSLSSGLFPFFISHGGYFPQLVPVGANYWASNSQSGKRKGKRRNSLKKGNLHLGGCTAETNRKDI